jgi:hypothetical protein
MGRRILVLTFAAACAASFIASAPAHADPPTCDDGPLVQYDCPAGNLCTGVIDGQCIGSVPPLLPPPNDVRVGVKGDIGVGIG